MDRIPSMPSPRFSGYRLEKKAQQARIFLPGHQSGKQAVSAEAVLPNSQHVVSVPLKAEGDYWVSKKALPLGTAYRFKVNDQPRLDWLEVVQRNGQDFNLISPHEAQAPQKSAVIADVFLDSLVTPEQLQQQRDQNQGRLPMRTHFNQYGGNEQGINALMPQLQDAGVSGLLFKPFVGGDNLSSHRYWTVDPYVLNNSFSSRTAFKQFLQQSLRRGMKLYADGAFVNQGLNGVQFLSNLAHGVRSPYWNWFTYEENNPQGPELHLPKHAFEKFTLGILPTRLDSATGHRDVDFSRFDIRLINNPVQPGYNPKKPVEIELYDPRLEHADGTPRRRPAKDTLILNSEDSVQKYRFPVSPEEVRQKYAQLTDPQQPSDSHNRKQLMLEWNHFRLAPASLDDSAFKWDGQIDVAKMNMKNPDVVNYLQGAVTQWTRLVNHTYLDTVTRALVQARQRRPQARPETLLNMITHPGDSGKQTPASARHVLPPISALPADHLDPGDLRQAMQVQPEYGHLNTPHQIAQQVTATMMAETPLAVLELPSLFKAHISSPRLQHNLATTSLNGLHKLAHHLLKPMTRIPLIGSGFETLLQWLTPPSFAQHLTRKMGDVVQRLTPEAQDKLRYLSMQSLAASPLLEQIYLNLFTDLEPGAETTPQQREEALYRTVPQTILKADPETAAYLLPRWLKQRLQRLDVGPIARQLEQHLEALDPQLAALAQHVLHQREFGLNWRIDAAKDVGDMDRVRNADLEDRPVLFREEIQEVQRFWSKLGDSIRNIFPKSAIIAELTDFEILSDDQTAQSTMRDLFSSNTFTSAPNMRYLYSQLHQLVNYAQRPDEFGASQMSPNDFVEQTLKPMSQAFPFPAVRQLQNLTSSHDYATSSHALLTNPNLFTMDLLRWWGLQDDLQEAGNELLNKPGFAAERQAIGSPEALGKALRILNQSVRDPDLQAKLSPEVRQMLSEGHKTASGQSSLTPAALKPRLVDELFAQLQPQDLGLNATQAKALKSALRARIAEPSEAKAMRAVIMNAFNRISNSASLPSPWHQLTRQNQSLSLRQSVQLQQIMQHALANALQESITRYGRHFGYQPLDVALDHVFQHVQLSNHFDGGAQFNQAQFIEDLKAQLYATAMQPVLPKLLRMFAVQNALPGNPSIYLPDLFAQGGSEYIKNIFVQNRNLIRVDKLTTDPAFQQFFQDAGRLFKTRQTLSSLNDGVLLPVPGDDRHGVLPIVRDNGKEQTITLVNTGKPSPLPWEMGKVGPQPEYAEIRSQQVRLTDYKPDLSALQQAPHTEYLDVQTGERFKLNTDGHLVDARDSQRGLDLHISRTLVRQSPSKR